MAKYSLSLAITLGSSYFVDFLDVHGGDNSEQDENIGSFSSIELENRTPRL